MKRLKRLLYDLPLIGMVLLQRKARTDLSEGLRHTKKSKQLDVIGVHISYRELMELKNFGYYNNFSPSLQKKLDRLYQTWSPLFEHDR